MAGVTGLNSPEDFMRLAKVAVGECETIRARMTPAHGQVPSGTRALEQLRDLDRISNTICGVIDAAEFARNVHADPAFREAAEETFDALSGYIQDLNTDSSLHAVLQSMTSCDASMAGFTEEQRRTATLLQSEFERDGIHLPAQERAAIAALQGEILRLETAFNTNISAPDAGGVVEVPLDAATCSAVLRGARDPRIRRQVLRSQNAACAQANAKVLEDLVDARQRLASSLGFDSFAHRSAVDKMLQSPDEVLAFLEDLSSSVKGKARDELQQLQDLKTEVEGEAAGPVQPWDLHFYMGHAKARRYRLDGSAISSYFTLDGCVAGLAKLCEGLFGIRLEERALAEGEAWDGGAARAAGAVAVRKLALSHPTKGDLGTVYLDLGARPGKFVHAAHYTIRCGVLYQRPIVALVASFGLPEASHGQRLLSHGELETLLHEFGHALHSLLSRTEFQHASGTRAPVDWVEVPSHLLEYFAWDERCLGLLSGHHATREPLPPDVARALRASKGMFAGLETQQQVLFASVDQQLFGRRSSDAASVESVVNSAQQKFRATLPGEGGPAGAWHCRFAHFTGYGAGYYSYLYDRVLAANIWQKRFAAEPLSREAGERFWRSILAHGGARDPHHMLSDMLGGDKPSPDCLLREWGVE
ncbi:putative mitochondrial intermediate peptidase [Tribonema minus]|uniref:Putative mitochondrial intermediate peptidase n=1 Tax=Tribonema minus TaxID=303371 RepID=A0A835ZB07_9STRA|nr:putative mitochondrial intermediate peptidase [Tribonema minus]